MSNRRFMVDIETLSVKNDAAVIAVGVAVFNRVEILDSHMWLIDPIYAIGHREQRTFNEFWNNPEMVTDDVRERMFSGLEKPWDVCDQFNQFYETWKPNEMWANPPQFDYIILRSMYEACEMIPAWHWREEKDFRTVKDMAKSLGIDYSSAYEGRQAHDARDDAIAQAKAIQLVWNRVLI